MLDFHSRQSPMSQSLELKLASSLQDLHRSCVIVLRVPLSVFADRPKAPLRTQFALFLRSLDQESDNRTILLLVRKNLLLSRCVLLCISRTELFSKRKLLPWCQKFVVSVRCNFRDYSSQVRSTSVNLQVRPWRREGCGFGSVLQGKIRSAMYQVSRPGMNLLFSTFIH